MKNLIYSICDQNYQKLLDIWFSRLRNHTTCDILLICPEHFETTHDIKLYPISEFDYKYLSKFIIHKWPEHIQYDNFLFLDLDIICQNPISDIFLTIESLSSKIHGVVEYPDLTSCNYFWRFDNIDKFDIQNCPAYNAGTFGFHRNLIYVFSELLEFIETHKTHAYCDQPIFNMFFNHRKLIEPSLSKYVYLDGYPGQNDISEYPLVHFLGHYGNSKNKIERIEKHVKN